MEYQLNFVAIAIATVANFFFGYLWYTPLFGKVWAKENGFDTTGGAKPGELANGLIMNLIGNFLLAYVMASNNEAWMFVPGMEQSPPGMTIFFAAVFTWLGFFVPVDLNAVAWERKSWKLFFINTGYHLLMLVIAATVLTLMP